MKRLTSALTVLAIGMVMAFAYVGISCSGPSCEERLLEFGIAKMCNEPVGFLGCFEDIPEECSSGLCRTGLVGGSFGASTAMCTEECSTDAGCQGFSWTQANDKSPNDYTETWTCTGGFCAVEPIEIGGPAPDICAGCGGVFCAGRCIGCPQCQ